MLKLHSEIRTLETFAPTDKPKQSFDLFLTLNGKTANCAMEMSTWWLEDAFELKTVLTNMIGGLISQLCPELDPHLEQLKREILLMELELIEKKNALAWGEKHEVKHRGQ